MLVVWQGARRCLSCSGQLTNQGCQLGQQRHHCGPIADKLDRYQLVDTRCIKKKNIENICHFIIVGGKTFLNLKIFVELRRVEAFVISKCKYQSYIDDLSRCGKNY
ncbi:trehalase-like isoform X1 [Vespula squamosa]|uniref:Trehalase-like isoform X1 n=1 Tax=Vespula squamosa TaxID=30214 RepID=A0ABD2AUU0_VESSQ